LFTHRLLVHRRTLSGWSKQEEEFISQQTQKSREIPSTHRRIVDQLERDGQALLLPTRKVSRQRLPVFLQAQGLQNFLDLQNEIPEIRVIQFPRFNLPQLTVINYFYARSFTFITFTFSRQYIFEAMRIIPHSRLLEVLVERDKMPNTRGNPQIDLLNVLTTLIFSPRCTF
jgi:hypothetical protein